MTIWNRLQNIDPRFIYAALLFVIVIPLLVPVSLPNIPSRPAVQAFETVETIARTDPHGFILIAADWAASTRGESHWQDIAVLRQVMSHHMRFAVVSFDTQNRSLEQADIATINDELAKSLPGYHRYAYGADYCLWGYRPSTAVPQFLKGLEDDLPGTVHADYRGNAISSLPCMRGISTLKQADAVLLVTPTSLLDNFLQFVVSKSSRTKLIYFPTAVMAPEGYPYLDSGQINGMVTGIKGAGDYEELEGVHGFAARISTALSLVYALILALIVIGNASYYIGRAAARRGGEAY